MEFISDFQKRVTYAETDRMGYLYYGNYPEYYEIGRTEALRKLGMTYLGLEESGIMMPVIDMEVKYLKPATYDENLTIRTIISEVPSARMKFRYEIYNTEGELINEAKTTLVFVSVNDMKPVRPPTWFVKIFMDIERSGKMP